MIAAASRPDSLLTRMGGLSDPTRLRLLHLLEKHELGVVELVEVLRLPQSTVSRHLKTLADQGWVRSRGRGAANLYRMAAPAARRGGVLRGGGRAVGANAVRALRLGLHAGGAHRPPPVRLGRGGPRL